MLIAIQGQVGQVVLGIASQEVKNPVPARVGARGKRGPSHRGLGRAAWWQHVQTPPAPSVGPVGQLACFEQPRNDAGVQTIQTEDDDLLDDTNPVERMTRNSASAITLRLPITHFLPKGVKSRSGAKPAGRQGRMSATVRGRSGWPMIVTGTLTSFQLHAKNRPSRADAVSEPAHTPLGRNRGARRGLNTVTHRARRNCP